MYAIVCNEEGEYYSPVFGYYKKVKTTDIDDRYVEETDMPYYVVWDKDGNRLIKWFAYVPYSNKIVHEIIIVDSDQTDWVLNNEEGCVNYLTKEIIDSIMGMDEQLADILDICREKFEGYVYSSYPEIKNEKDIEDFMWAASGLHDARIVQKEIDKDGTLYLKIHGIWGCDIEIWFWGDIEYTFANKDIDDDENYWIDSSIIIENGFVYLIDEEDMTVDGIKEYNAWFKARHMKYHILPN